MINELTISGARCSKVLLSSLIPHLSDLSANTVLQVRRDKVAQDSALQSPFYPLAHLEGGSTLRAARQMPVDFNTSFNQQLAADVGIQNFIYSLTNHRIIKAEDTPLSCGPVLLHQLCSYLRNLFYVR